MRADTNEREGLTQDNCQTRTSLKQTLSNDPWSKHMFWRMVGWRAGQEEEEEEGRAFEPPRLSHFLRFHTLWQTFADGCEDDFLKTSYFVRCNGISEHLPLAVSDVFIFGVADAFTELVYGAMHVNSVCKVNGKHNDIRPMAKIFPPPTKELKLCMPTVMAIN